VANLLENDPAPVIRVVKLSEDDPDTGKKGPNLSGLLPRNAARQTTTMAGNSRFCGSAEMQGWVNGNESNCPVTHQLNFRRLYRSMQGHEPKLWPEFQPLQRGFPRIAMTVEQLQCKFAHRFNKATVSNAR
jgi:hypothetical protein